MLGGHENAEFRDHGDRIEVYSLEDGMGHVGWLEPDELIEISRLVEDVMIEGTYGTQAPIPDLDDIQMAQHESGALMLLATDGDEVDPTEGVVFPNPEVVVESAEDL